jgi:protoporphyrinogen/coproporphyrinogen III oxidase
MGTDFEHIVIGGGISGLGLAHRAQRRGVATLVLERGDRVGGCMNTQTFDGCGGFWAEAGSHTCFNSYGHLIDTLADLDLLGQLAAKAKVGYSLWQGGRRHSILSSLHKLELLASMPRLFTIRKGDSSVAQYYGGGLGRANYRDVFGPAFRAVICQEPDDYPAEVLFRRKPRRKEVLRAFTLPGGLSGIPEAIAAQAGLSVRTGVAVQAIRKDGDGFRVTTAEGEEHSCHWLTLAVPPDVAAALLPSELEGLRQAVGQIAVAETETVVVCVPAQDLAHLPPLAGLIAVDDAFYSMVSRDYLPDPQHRGFAFHFRPGALDADGQLDRICRALGVREDHIAGLVRVINRLPALRVGHRALIERIDGLLAGGRLALTGNWFLGVSVEDCMTRSHTESERLFGS